MKIGVDFGTTYTKIAFLNPRGTLELFEYPPPPAGKQFVPTALAYRNVEGNQVMSLGDGARSDVLNLPDTQFHENFKMLLPLDAAQWSRYGWNGSRSPAEVTRDYLRLLLLEAEESFAQRYGSITSLVVSVPEVWQRTMNMGAETLRTVLMDDLQLPVDHLRSEPMCAAAFFVHEYRRTERHTRPFNLLVCDMGGGTFDVALCRVTDEQIRVLAFDGNGQSGIGRAGVYFDRAVVQSAYQQVQNQAPDLESDDFVELVRAFEKVKLDKQSETRRLLKLAQDTNLADTPLYQWKRKYTITVDQARACFAPVSEGITQVLARIKQQADQQNWTIDRVALVGGFCEFPLVEQTILSYLGIEDINDVRFSRTLNSENRFYAIAKGAALIANGMIKPPVEYYPHTLEMMVHRERPILMEEALPLVEAGQMEAGRAAPYYARNHIRVNRADLRELPIRIRLLGSGQPVPLAISEVESPTPGRYRVGILIDSSNLGWLVFDPVEGGGPRKYYLGNVSPGLIVEEAQ